MSHLRVFAKPPPASLQKAGAARASCVICTVRLHRKRLAMVSRCTRLAIGPLALCVASSAGAQETLERGKTLYASNCVTCHESPQSVTTSHGGVDLETFLGEHYPVTPKSAAAIATYLKGLERYERHPIPRRRPKTHRTEANPSQPSASEPLPASAEPKVGDPWDALKRLLNR